MITDKEREILDDKFIALADAFDEFSDTSDGRYYDDEFQDACAIFGDEIQKYKERKTGWFTEKTKSAFIALTIAFDEFTDTINGNDCIDDQEFLEASTAFYDAMQAFRARHGIDYGIEKKEDFSEFFFELKRFFLIDPYCTSMQSDINARKFDSVISSLSAYARNGNPIARQAASDHLETLHRYIASCK